MERVVIDRSHEGVALVEMRDPQRRNALSSGLVGELREAFAELAAERACRAIVLAAEGRGFCSGADMSFSGAPFPDTEGRGPVGVVQKSQEHLAKLILEIREAPQPVIAAVNGAAIGGGLALSLACDLRIASDDAFFAAHFIRVGLSSCDVGTSYLLPRIVGAARAAELMLTGRRFSAEDAERMGLVARVVPLPELRDSAYSLGDEIAANSEYGVYMTKIGLWANLDAPSLRHAMELENRTQVLGSFTGNMNEAGAAFMEKRDPSWKPM